MERRTVAGRAFTLTAGSGLDLVLTLRMVLTRTWGGELLAALLAISIATLLTDVWPLPFGVFAGALAGGAFLGMSLSQGIRVYACVTAVLAVALCLSDPLSMPGLFLECFYAATWLVAAHAVDQAIRESTGG